MSTSSSYSWSVDSSRLDHTEKFEARFHGRTFSSYKDFTAELKEFQEECLVNFRVRSSVLSRPGDACVYKRLLFVCVFSDLEHASESVGIRHRRSKSRGCPAKFSVYQKDGVLVVSEKSAVLIHNHRCSEMEYRLEVATRRLTREEKREIMKHMVYGGVNVKARLLARVEYKKYLTRSDVSNLRCHLIDTVVPAASWSEFEQLVAANGGFTSSSDEQGRLECISFTRTEQGELFSRYPEVLCVDATYHINRSRFCLLQFVITDGLGHGRPVMYSLMRNERCSTYVTAFLDFRDLMPNVRKVQTFMVDMSHAQMKALETVFPGKKIMLCHFHLLRAIRRKTTNRVIWHWVKRMMLTTSRIKFNAFCQRLRRRHAEFYRYFLRVWLRHAHRWAVCMRSGTVCLGNQTNNRCESAHRWLKMDLCAADSLLTCCKRIWLSSHQMLVDYMCDVAISRIKRPVVPFNNPLSGVVQQLTRYAAELVLKEWESSSSNALRAVGVGRNFRVEELVSTRRLTYKLDLSKAHCSCLFHQYYAMPCRHLVFTCMQAKVPLDTLLVNSRWLDVHLDGIEPPELSFHPAPRPVRKLSIVGAHVRRTNLLRRKFRPRKFKRMMDFISTVQDWWEIKKSSESSSHSSPPPLRQRLSITNTSEITTLPQPAGTSHATETSALPHTPFSSTPVRPPLRKLLQVALLPVDLDKDDKENVPPPSTSHSSK